MKKIEDEERDLTEEEIEELAKLNLF